MKHTLFQFLALFTVLIIAGCGTISPPDEKIPDPVSQWTFENSPKDSKGECDLSLYGSPSYNADCVEGKYAIHLDGTNYAEAKDCESLAITKDLTLSAWIKIKEFNKDNFGVISKWDISGTTDNDQKNERAYQIYITKDGNPVLTVSTDGSSNSIIKLASERCLKTGEWTHIVGRYQAGKSLSIFVNGICWGTNTTNIPSQIHNSSAALWIGIQSTPANCNVFFNGNIDDVRIYNVALSDNQIAKLAARQ